jgi:hypothetical protein
LSYWNRKAVSRCVPLGIDFVDHVTEQIAKCSAVIVMIGKQWLTIKDKKRRRRIDNEDDHVRAEVRGGGRPKPQKYQPGHRAETGMLLNMQLHGATPGQHKDLRKCVATLDAVLRPLPRAKRQVLDTLLAPSARATLRPTDTPIDWTRSASVATYFAAKSALLLARKPGGHPTGRVAVWAIDFTWVSTEPLDVTVVTAPAAGIENLRAQQGLFLLARDLPRAGL